MVLQRANFEIPAQFVFRPFEARWIVGYAEILQWKPERTPPAISIVKPILPERERLLVDIRFSDGTTSGMLGGLLDPGPQNIVEIDRDDIPSEALAAHQNRKNTPDLTGRGFEVLVYSDPEFNNDRLLPSNVRSTEKPKNAWGMLKEFFDLEDDDWVWNLRRFLNRWGLWSFGFGFNVPWGDPTPAFCLAFPHKIREARERFRKGILPQYSRQWLSTDAGLSFSTVDTPPYFRVERHYCEHAIRTVITIEHLAKRRWGFCKRCGKLFERETEHKKSYCSRRCIQAAGVQRWRDKQRKSKRTKGAE